jgi:ATP-dependent Clp protease ATP-binding subunit ClpA
MASPDCAEDIFQPSGRLRLDLFNEGALKVLRESLRLARETRWDCVRSPHVFMGLLASPDARVSNWGDRLRADLPKLLNQFQELFHQDDGESEPILALTREFFSDNVIRLLREARSRALDHDRTRVTPMDLLIILLTAAESIVAECFERIGVTRDKLAELAFMAEKQAGRD